jgi:quercetin dioxygenase-like cupin family protein
MILEHDDRKSSNHGEVIMRRTLLAAAIGAAIGASGLSLANHQDHGQESVKVLSARDVIEKLDGKEARVTTVEVTLGPEVAGNPHRHPGPIFGYVLEGEFELGLDDQSVKTLKAGETFYEPSGALHRVSRNPSAKNKTRVLAVILHPRDAKEIVTPAGKE